MLEKELSTGLTLAAEAAELAMEHYRAESYDVDQKAGDAGPVTTADKVANQHITAGLRKAFPEDALVAEESAQDAEFKERTWFIDPIDGTKEFIAANGQFAVMIGLAIEGEPRLGIVFHPPSRTATWGIVGHGAFHQKGTDKEPITVSSVESPRKALIVRSRSHPSETVTAVCEMLGIERQERMGSFGRKVSKVASGAAELYINASNRSSLWDGAGPQAILVAAGGTATDKQGRPITYEKQESLYLLNGFVGSNGPFHGAVIDALGEIEG